MKPTTAELIEVADLDALTDRTDALCFDHAWAGVVDLRDRCRAALERGKQLWPAAAYAEYRLALDAPAPVAASVVDSGADRFTVGPFPEILASTHTFAQLGPHLARSPAAAVTAQECVVRGEDLRADPFAVALPDVLGLPLALQAWEPSYPLASYEQSKGLFPPPPLPVMTAVAMPLEAARRVREPVAVEALVDLAQMWVTASNGRSQAAAVEGRAADAIAALVPPAIRIAAITGAEAMAWMAWAGASGGANGRRRGMAAGRHAAWWALAAIGGLAELEGDAATPDELGEALADLRWFLWDDGAPAPGWALRLAVEDAHDGLAWAVSATDVRRDNPT